MASLSEIGIKGHHYCLPVAHVVIGRCEYAKSTCVGVLTGVNQERVLIEINRKYPMYTQRTT